MTATMVPQMSDLESTPESQDLTRLRALLEDPELSGFHDDIRAAIEKLVATSVLAA